MLARLGVCGGVLVRRVVAAADVPAREADAQVQPLAAAGEAVHAAVDGLGELGDRDLVEVRAAGHVAFLFSGRRTVNAVAPGWDSTRSEPSWRSATIRRAVASPSPVPWPTSLVVKKGSNSRSRASSGMPGPSSATVISVQSPSRRVEKVIVPLLAERVDRVVEQVRPHLVELGAVDGDLRQRLVVVALDLDVRVLELVAEDHQRGLEPLVDVDLDQLAAVHVGVRLDRLDERRHALGGLAQLGRQAVRGERRRHPAQRRVRGRAGDSATPVDPGRRRRRRRPAARPAATPRRRPGPPGGRAGRPRRRRRPARRPPAATPPARSPRAGARSAARPPRAPRPPRRSGAARSRSCPAPPPAPRPRARPPRPGC